MSGPLVLDRIVAGLRRVDLRFEFALAIAPVTEWDSNSAAPNVVDMRRVGGATAPTNEAASYPTVSSSPELHDSLVLFG